MATVFWHARGIILTEGSKNHRAILCNTSKPFTQKTANGMSEIDAQKNPFSSRQRTGSHFRSFNGKSAWIRVQNFALFALFSWFGSFWLLFIFKPQDLARGKEILRITSAITSSDKEVIAAVQGFETSYFSEEIKKIRRALDEVCRSRRRLCWKIKKNLA